MKNLILVLFAIVTLSFGINAQDFSFKTFNQTVKPKGELFAKFEAKGGNSTLYVFNEWDEYSITQWHLGYDTENQEAYSLRKFKFFYDEINYKLSSVSLDENSDFKNVYKIGIQGKSNVVLITDYSNSGIEESAINFIYVNAQNETQAKGFIEKLKEKAFDMSLDLEAKVERVSLGEKKIFYNEDYPNGISATDLAAVQDAEIKAYKNSENESKNTDDEEETTTTKTNTNSTNNSANNNSTPKEKTEIWLKLRNKSNDKIEISYENYGKGSGKTQTSISGRTTRSVKMKVGGRVFGASGNILLIVSADMDDTEQVIAN